MALFRGEKRHCVIIYWVEMKIMQFFSIGMTLAIGLGKNT